MWGLQIKKNFSVERRLQPQFCKVGVRFCFGEYFTLDIEFMYVYFSENVGSALSRLIFCGRHNIDVSRYSFDAFS